MPDSSLVAGMVTSYSGDLSIPSNLAALTAEGWLLCDGASYPQKTYSDLYKAIGSAHGASGESFNVPDLRDIFVRGVNGAATFGGASADPDTASRTSAAAGGATGNNVGSVQTYATAAPRKAYTLAPDGEHTHTVQHLTDSTNEVWGGSTDSMARDPYNTVTTSSAGGHTHTISGGDAATLPVSLSLYFVIFANNV